ncbi:hypothetical protein FKQ51_18450 [Bacillus toyonensis]|nr:hypothetical protein [Bacillus toyonensis]
MKFIYILIIDFTISFREFCTLKRICSESLPFVLLQSFSKCSYTLEKRNEENHTCDILKGYSSNEILF